MSILFTPAKGYEAEAKISGTKTTHTFLQSTHA